MAHELQWQREGRASAGITNGRVFRNADDPNEVVILQDVADVAKARTWFGSDDMKDGDAKERRHRLPQRPIRRLTSRAQL